MTTGIAYIIETREHPALEMVLKNMDQCLPKNWQIWCFHSSENKKYCSTLINKIDRETRLIRLKSDINNLQNYTDLLLSESFWKQFSQENLLGFQTDTLMNESEKSRFEEFYSFDYVGAPWAKGIQNRWNYIPDFGGNGGFCYSKKSARLRALKESITPKISGHPFYQNLQEDVWFSTAMAELGMKLPSFEQASTMLTESIFTENPIAVHKPWDYLSKSDYQKLLQKIPALDSLKAKSTQTKNIPAYSSYRRFLLQFGRSSIFTHQYDIADSCLQMIHSRYPKKSYAAYNLQALMSFHVGAYSQGKRFAEAALECEPQFTKAKENLRILKQYQTHTLEQKQHKEPQDEKFLAISTMQSDLEPLLKHLPSQLLLSEISDRTPILQKLKRGHPLSLLEPISKRSFSDLKKHKKSIYPEQWQNKKFSDDIKISIRTKKTHLLKSISRDETILINEYSRNLKSLVTWIAPGHDLDNKSAIETYQWLANKYFKQTKATEKKVEEFLQRNFNNEDFIAIHLMKKSSIDELHGSNINAINAHLIEQLSSFDDSLKIFVLGDDQRNLNLIKKKWGKRVVTISKKSELLDALIAKNAKHFLACGLSHTSCFIASNFNDKQQTLLPFNVLSRFENIPKMEDHQN